jgi:fermentation-respiration switch protein FrsA (DUF1100 family)
MMITILIITLSSAAALTGFYFLAGAMFFFVTLTRKAANGGFNLLSDEDALLGKEGEEKKKLQGGFWRRLISRLLDKSSGLNNFYDKPYYPSFYAGLKWFFDNKPQKITINSKKGERLHADVFLNTSNVWFICLHGFTSSPRDFGGAAKVYHDDWGCNVLLPYLRAHKESESNYVSMGWLDRLEVVAWIEYIIREYNNPKIILHGVSMGSATTMMTVGEDLPENVKCAISDCGFTSFWDECKHQINGFLHLPTFPFVYAIDTYVRILLGFSMKEASSIEQLKKSKTPVLFIHGQNDEFVPLYMLDQVYEACAAEKEKLVFADAGHSESCYQLDKYYGAIKKFAGSYVPELSN